MKKVSRLRERERQGRERKGTFFKSTAFLNSAKSMTPSLFSSAVFIHSSANFLMVAISEGLINEEKKKIRKKEKRKKEKRKKKKENTKPSS